MKKYFVLLLLLLVVGCSYNKPKYVNIENIVKNNDFLMVYSTLNKTIGNVQNFPTEKDEIEFIYYLRAIKNNINKFSKNDISMLNSLLDFEYNFRYNKENYNMNSFNSDKEFFREYINR